MTLAEMYEAYSINSKLVTIMVVILTITVFQCT